MPGSLLQATSFHSLALMLRGRAALTQRELAAAIGVSERTIQVWEAGLGYPSAASLQRLIAVYVARHAFTARRETDEAAAFWGAALAEAPRLKTAFDAEWFAGLLATAPDASVARPGRGASNTAAAHTDWGEAPALGVFHGRASEQQTLARWLLDDTCRVVGITGMGGIGKTALAARVAQELAPRFDAVFWRSLRNAPPCADWLAEAILCVSEQRSVPPAGEEARRRRLLELLRERRCLLILDNLETVLEPGVAHLGYRDGYAGYGQVLQLVGETLHTSRLLVTSREQPPELGQFGGPGASVRVLRLAGLDDDAGQSLLADKGLRGDVHGWGALVRRYRGNALALRLVGEFIARVFGGDIAAFLTAGDAVFGDIRRLLQAQLARASATERAVLYWLALDREPVDFQTLAADLGPGVPRHDILDALDNLDRRSLLEVGGAEATFTLQPVVLEHVTEEIIATAAAELDVGQPALLVTHALVKGQTMEYVRRSQERLVAQPLLQRMAASRPKEEIECLLLGLLEHWRGRPHGVQGFGPGNVVTLLRLSRGDLRGLDLSRLVLRQTNLWGIDARDVSLAHARLEDVMLAQQVGAAVCAHLSADGACLAVGTIVGEVRVWRLTDLSPILLAKQPVGPAWDIAVTADAQLLASGGGPGAIWLWVTDGSQSQSLLSTDPQEVWCVALSADGRVVAGGTGDGTARLWDTSTRRCLHRLACHAGGVRGLALSHDGQLLATGGADGEVAIWDIRNGARLLHRRRYAGEARAVALSADGRLVANGDGDGVVHVWDTCTGEPQVSLGGHTGPIWAVALSATGDLLASGGADHTLRMWDTRRGECQRVLHEHAAGVMMTSLSGDGRRVASVALDGSVRVWDTRRGRCLDVLHGNVPAVFEVALSADGRLAVSGGGDGAVRVWDTASGHCLQRLAGHVGAVWAIALSADGALAVSGALDATVRVWHLSPDDPPAILTGHTLGVTSVALSPDRRLIASGSFDGTLRLWDAASGECLRVQPCHVAGVRMVRFSADGQLLVSGELHGAARVWDANTGECLHVLNSGSGELRAVALSADGRRLACAEPGGRVRLWDTRSGRCMRLIQGQTTGIRTVALSADGKMMLSGGTDSTLQVWDLDNPELPRVLHGHSAEVWGLALSMDDRLAASGGLDGTVRLWDLERGGNQLRTMRPDRPYERMDITGVAGITDTQRTALLALGAVAT